MTMFKHILIPTDGSALSRSAALAGVKLASKVGARVTALFAAPAATPLVYRNALPVGYRTPAEHEKAIAKASKAYLAVIENAAREAGVRCQSVQLTSDFPAEAILEAARKHGCDLIFMASHSRRGLRGLLIGSQTQKVLAAAKVAVLVYR
jgi:nucleotide-binding universal stress UspA family protein